MADVEFSGLSVHPVLTEFPTLSGDEFAALVGDIRQHGLRQPILIDHAGEILLDGRSRFRACQEAGVEPRFEKIAPLAELQTIRLIVSMNLNRRHLNPGQLAVVALRLEALIASSRSRGRPAKDTLIEANLPQFQDELRAPQSRDLAAQILGISGRSIQKAKAVRNWDPDLLDEIKSGTRTLDDAHKSCQRQAKARAENFPDQPEDEATATKRVVVILQGLNGTEVPYQAPERPSFNATNEQVSWARFTWNPVTGCLHGCPYCYAREMALSERYRNTYPIGFAPLFHHERLSAPMNTKIPEVAARDPVYGRCFVCSMADLYGKWVPDEWIAQVHDAMLAAPHWEYLLLTKFPKRYVGLKFPPSAWVGTSIDEPNRVPVAEAAFREIKDVRVKWLSLEPLKADLKFSNLSIFDWIVIGSQSATRQPEGIRGRNEHGWVPESAPPFEWVARIISQAREAGVPMYCKPNLLGITNPQSAGMTLPMEAPRLR